MRLIRGGNVGMLDRMPGRRLTFTGLAVGRWGIGVLRWRVPMCEACGHRHPADGSVCSYRIDPEMCCACDSGRRTCRDPA